jgi:hypothetical protein
MLDVPVKIQNGDLFSGRRFFIATAICAPQILSPQNLQPDPAGSDTQ